MNLASDSELNGAEGTGKRRLSFQVASNERQLTSEPRRRASCCHSSILEPTKAIDKGWSWVIVVASFILSFVLYGVLASFGVIYVPLTVLYSGQNESSDSCSANVTPNATGSVSGQTAWIGNTMTLLIFSLGPFSAALSKRWGVRPVVFTGSILFSTGIILTGLTNEMWQAFLTYGILGGVGGSMIHSPGVGIVPAYFDKHRTLAVCITQVGGSIGIMAITPVVGAIEAEYGWRRACFFAGGVSCSVILAALLYRPQHISETESRRTPSVKEIVVGAWKTQRKPRFAVWVWLIGLHFFSLYVVLVHIYRHSECVLGISKYKSSFLLTYASAVSIVVSIVSGYIGDRLQYRLPLLQFLIFIGGIGNVFFPLYRTYADLIGFMILFGINYSYLALMTVFPSEFVGVDEAVNAFSILSFTSSIFGALGGTAAGWIFDATGSYDVAFVLSGILSICVSLMMSLDLWLIRIEKRRNEAKPTKKADDSVEKSRRSVAQHESSV